MLVSMGFTRTQAQQALIQVNNNIEFAANMLFSGV